MLKEVVVENFVYFKERQLLNFEEGPYYLIGENDSGKSSFIEIIRRCMGKTKNTRVTNPNDADKPSVALCRYQHSNGDIVVSGFYRKANSKKKANDIFRNEDQIKKSHDAAALQTSLRKEINPEKELKATSKSMSDSESHEQATESIIIENATANQSKEGGCIGGNITDTMGNESNAMEDEDSDKIIAEKEDKNLGKNIPDTMGDEDRRKRIANTIEDEDTGENITDKIKDEQGDNMRDVESGKNITDTETFLKLIYVCSKNSKDKNQDFEVDVVQEGEKQNLVWCPIGSTENKDKLKRTFAFFDDEHKNMESNSIDGIMKGISDLLYSFDVFKHPFSTDNTQCEKLLKQYVNKTTVITFPFRSLAPCQWTKSKRLKHEEKENTTKQTHENEEIVAWYLEKVNDNVISEEEKKREESYFELITNNPHYEFKYDDGKISGYSRMDNKAPFILKVPEGIYEAKTLSILLALDRFSTICLEDPERGMHSQMVDRLRDLVLQQMKKKVILIVSHHPGFVSHLTLKNVFLFKRKMDFTSEIRKPVDQNDKTARIITIGQAPLLFFAEQLLFVEGDGDYYFVFFLKYLMCTEKDDLLLPFVKKLGEERSEPDSQPIMDEVRRFLLSIQIVTMVGEANKFRYRQFCRDLEKPNLFLMDKDALYHNLPGVSQDDKKACVDRFFELFDLKNDEQRAKVHKGEVAVLEKDGIFFWENGAIENALSVLCDKNPDLTKYLTDRRIHWPKVNEKTSKPEPPPVSESEQKSETVCQTQIDESKHQSTATEAISRSSEGSENKQHQASIVTHSANNAFAASTPVTSQSNATSNRDVINTNSGELRTQRKVKCKKKMKIFSDKELTNENICEAVREIIKISRDDPKSEFQRLIMFLLRQSKKSKI